MGCFGDYGAVEFYVILHAGMFKNMLPTEVFRMNGKLRASAREDPKACQLMTVRGIGSVISTALLAKQAEPERFANARQFAAYFGSVPDQHSSGQKVRLGKMSKRGDAYPEEAGGCKCSAGRSRHLC